LIDLHMHTTASDGRLTPSELVARAAAVGLTTISVTDHDTVAALAEVRQHAAAANIALVSGIEVTSVSEHRDVHILGYFLDESDRAFARFLQVQRTERVERVRQIAARLAQLGYSIGVERLLEDALRTPGVSVGRPTIARALIEAGHVTSVQEAFDRLLAAGQPAYVPRDGRSPQEVIDVIHAAGGIASLAHPGLTRRPDLFEPLADHGLDAIEAYHTDHTPEAQADALAIARQLNLLITGGSDYHGDDERRRLGGVTLPAAAFEALAARATR
jgi:predicted metal-dependent phosphoesterase TrpH